MTDISAATRRTGFLTITMMLGCASASPGAPEPSPTPSVETREAPTSRASESPHPEADEAIAPSATITSLPRCEAVTRSERMLERYDELVPGARFHLNLAYDPALGVWMPTPDLEMPFHHASALHYVDFTLPPAMRETIKLHIDAVEIVREAPREGTFFVTYRVRVIDACVHR